MSTIVDYPGMVPPPPGRTADIANREDVLYSINLVTHILCTVVATTFVMMRVWVKWRILPPFGIDDWCILITWLLSLAHFATAFGMGQGGGGHNLWEVTPKEHQIFMKSMYADTIIYGPNTWFLKVTLLLAITRVFTVNRRFVIFIYVFMAVMAAYYVPVFFLKIRICDPIWALWDTTVKKPKCISNRPIFVADTTLSAVTDLAVLLLPIPLIMKLQMSWRKKVKVYVLLGAGGVATAASFIRMVLVVRMQRSSNHTVDFIQFNLPCSAEVTIGLICACLPAVNKALGSRERREKAAAEKNHPSPHFAPSSTPRFLQRMRARKFNGTDTADLFSKSDFVECSSRTSSSAPMLRNTTTDAGGARGGGGGGRGGDMTTNNSSTLTSSSGAGTPRGGYSANNNSTLTSYSSSGSPLKNESSVSEHRYELLEQPSKKELEMGDEQRKNPSGSREVERFAERGNPNSPNMQPSSREVAPFVERRSPNTMQTHSITTTSHIDDTFLPPFMPRPVPPAMMTRHRPDGGIQVVTTTQVTYNIDPEKGLPQPSGAFSGGYGPPRQPMGPGDVDWAALEMEQMERVRRFVSASRMFYTPQPPPPPPPPLRPPHSSSGNNSPGTGPAGDSGSFSRPRRPPISTNNTNGYGQYSSSSPGGAGESTSSPTFYRPTSTF